MDKKIDIKLESLQKYVPFIDYVVKINSEKYVKFADIRKWIVDRKRLPLSDLNKVEQSITTCYKNIILLEDMKMPSEIAHIFYDVVEHQFINLCSDDEEDNVVSAESKQENDKPSVSKPAAVDREAENSLDSDDDIEIVSVSYLPKASDMGESSATKTTPKEEVGNKKPSGSPPPAAPVVNDLDVETAKLLEQIDEITNEDLKDHKKKYTKPHNYHVVLSDDEVETKAEELFQRRPRRIESKSTAGKTSASRDTILLDSSDEDEDTAHKKCDESLRPQPIANEVDENNAQLRSKRELSVPESEKSLNNEKVSASNGTSDVQIENLNEQEMSSFIEQKIKTLDFSQLQALCKSMAAAEVTTIEAPLKATKENEAPSSENSGNNKELESNLDDIVAPPAPRIPPADNTDRLIKVLCDLLEKAYTKTGHASASPVGGVEKPNICGDEEKQSNSPAPTFTTQEYQCQYFTPQQPPSNFYNMQSIQPMPPTQPSLHPQTGSADAHPLYPPTFIAPFNPQQPTLHIPSTSQTLTPAQTIFKSRDPRARSALYQKSLQIIKDEMAKKSSTLQTGSAPRLNVPAITSTATSKPSEFASYAASDQNKSSQYLAPQLQQQQRQQDYVMPNNVPAKETSPPPATERPRKSVLTYGEYKRRRSEEQQKQREKQLRHQEALLMEEAECKRRKLSEEKLITDSVRIEETIIIHSDKDETDDTEQPVVIKANKSADKNKIANFEAEKQRSDLHSILLSTLQPYEDKIQKIWMTKKYQNSTKDKDGNENDNDNESESENANRIGKKRKNEAMQDANKECQPPSSNKAKSMKTNPENGDGEKKSPDKSNSEDKNNRIKRMLKEMECTVKGFEKLTNTIGSRRRSSIHARSVITEQLNSSQESETNENNETLAENAEQTKSMNQKGKEKPTQPSALETLDEEMSVVHYPTPPPRRSSIHALSAIAEQLKSQSSMDSTDVSITSNDSRKVGPEDERASAEKETMNAELRDIESVSIGNAGKVNKVNIPKRQPRIMLQRLTESEIKKHTKEQMPAGANNILKVQLIESGVRHDTADSISKPSGSAPKRPALKRYNNDCQMTERSTKFCVLCTSKPSDLTNHYKRKHKCESYVSRLTWSELDELSINTPFAKLVAGTNRRIDRYEIVCPFCDEKIVMPFMHLYNHYSTHTGEYAFQCGACQLEKPFRADIQSHQLHSKSCRNSQIQTLYRYPSNTMSIYLHYCTICNFVQINEANILKHLREHHDPRKSTADNVQKCILAAISDGPDLSCEESIQTNSVAPQLPCNESDGNKDDDMNDVPVVSSENITAVITKSEIDLNLDDNIPVFNEACSEESFDLEERLRQMHEEQSYNTPSHPQEPMTIIHINSSSFNCELKLGTTKTTARHVPKIIKMEPNDLGDNVLPTSPQRSASSNTSSRSHVTSYSIYRHVPPNVNYLGFFKCMIGDCFYSSDDSEEFAKHLEDHELENSPEECLLCPYCITTPPASCRSVHDLVIHFQTKHAYLVYQCSTCCYRSCESSNVLIHQKENHPSMFLDCKIYKCPGPTLSADLKYIKANMCESIKKVQCPHCVSSYFNISCLMQHIKSDHGMAVEDIKQFSCVYCHFRHKEQYATRKHMALNHPGELPFLCDHNSPAVAEDSLHALEATDLSEPVPFIEVKATYDSNPAQATIQQDSIEDIKPSIEELIRCQAKSVKMRLLKLTEKTGIAPDCLYRCPEPTCSRFFSIYDLWLRHMKTKHHCLESRCPHCPTPTTKTLEDFKVHFEEHRRHTYVCFHCPLTVTNSNQAHSHWQSDHTALGTMHTEKIRFNLNYSYHVIIDLNSYQNQQQLYGSLLDVIDKRIKDLEGFEATKLKHKWLVPRTPATTWLEDYPQHALTPKLVKKCFNGKCTFRTKCDEALFSHVRSNHDISGSIFKCSKCDFRLENSSCWDEALNHIKQHSETSFFICGACSSHFLCRSKISDHIRSTHAARDVPVINLLKEEDRIYARIAIVFANAALTFSTIRNCFCCEERSICGNALLQHLKRYHNFVLKYFCEWCNMPIASLLSVENHFSQVHTTNSLKIRCELASKVDLSLLSISELKVHISSNTGDPTSNRLHHVSVKTEPIEADDSVTILEDEDVLLEDFEKAQQSRGETTAKPKLKCIAMESLLDEHLASEKKQMRILPRVKIVQKRQPTMNTAPSVEQSVAKINAIAPAFTPDSAMSNRTIIPTISSASTRQSHESTAISGSQLSGMITHLAKSNLNSHTSSNTSQYIATAHSPSNTPNQAYLVQNSSAGTSLTSRPAIAPDIYHARNTISHSLHSQPTRAAACTSFLNSPYVPEHATNNSSTFQNNSGAATSCILNAPNLTARVSSSSMPLSIFSTLPSSSNTQVYIGSTSGHTPCTTVQHPVHASIATSASVSNIKY